MPSSEQTEAHTAFIQWVRHNELWLLNRYMLYKQNYLEDKFAIDVLAIFWDEIKEFENHLERI